MNVEQRSQQLSPPVLLAILLAGVGFVAGSQRVLLATLIPIGYVVYRQATALPPTDVSLERRIDDQTPPPGSVVPVTVTVTNDSDRVLPEIQIVDGVPPELAVDGSPRHVTALRPGESTTFEYQLLARRGTHTFTETTLYSRSFSGAEAWEATRAATGCDTITCRAVVGDSFNEDKTHQYTGRVPTDIGGSGTEFYSTREYQHSDAVNRIDWNRYAKSGELTTVEYREQRGAPFVVVVDMRSKIAVAEYPNGPTATELALYAANQTVRSLCDQGNIVGVAFQSDSTVRWLPPGRGENYLARAELAFSGAVDRNWSNITIPIADSRRRRSQGRTWSSATTDSVAGDGGVQHGIQLERLEARFDTAMNVIVVTPLLDCYGATATELFTAFGHSVTVLSPDITGNGSEGTRLAGVQREVVASRVRRSGGGIVDWNPTDPIGISIERATEGHQ